MLGTAFIMTALIMQNNELSAACLTVNFVMMTIAYNVSGGHFNPAISVGIFVAEKDWGSNLITLGLMVGG